MVSLSWRTGAYALLASWAATVVTAQVTSDCFPMNQTCPPKPAFGMDYNFVFNMTPPIEAWESYAGPVKYDKDLGAVFTINEQGQSPTIRTRFYFLFGRTEVWLKVARGTGIISSMMWLSDNLDEVDWEFFGNNETTAQSNYFGKGEPNYLNAVYHQIPSVMDDYHNYTTVWTAERLDFHIDGQHVRTLLPKDADNGYHYPQTPMRLSLGIWAGGDPRLPEGTREWAGGDTNFADVPFSMYVKSAHITDYSKNAMTYEYTDRSGSWESIKITEGNSTVNEVLNKEPEKTMAQKFDELPSGAKIGIYAGGGTVGAALLGLALFYCIRQRRRGAQEAAIAEKKAMEERAESEQLRKRGVNPDAFAKRDGDYEIAELRNDGTVTSMAAVGRSDSMNSASWGVMGAPPPRHSDDLRSPVPLLGNESRSGSPGPNGRPYTPNSPGGAGYAMRDGRPGQGPSSPMSPTFPYNNNGAGSPRSMGSPHQSQNRPYNGPISPMGTARSQSPARFGGPPRAGSPAGAAPRSPHGMHPQGRGPAMQSPNRSASTPNTYMRQSPGPGAGYGAPRLQSPAPMPPRSNSAAPMAGYGGHAGYQDQDRGYPSHGNQGRPYQAQQGDYASPSGGYGNDGYWNNNHR